MIADIHLLFLTRKKSRKRLSVTSIRGQFLYNRAKMRGITVEIDFIKRFYELIRDYYSRNATDNDKLILNFECRWFERICKNGNGYKINLEKKIGTARNFRIFYLYSSRTQ